MSYKQLGFTALIALFTTSACTPHKTLNAPSLDPNHNTQIESKSDHSKQQAKTLNHWEITGAIAAHNAKKGWTASFHWIQHHQDEYQIRLFGPLGGGTVLIEHQNGLTTYQDGPQVNTSHNADNLLKQKTGIALPVDNLYYWVRGLPAPGPIQSIKYDTFHRLHSFQQAGYTIEYPKIQTVNHIDLPKQIKLQNKGVSIKVAIKQWKIN